MQRGPVNCPAGGFIGMRRIVNVLLVAGISLLYSQSAVAGFQVDLVAAVADQSGGINNTFNDEVASGQVSAEGTLFLSAEIGFVDLDAFASADLATGELKVLAICPEIPQFCLAQATFADTLVFDLTSLDSTEFITLEIFVSVDGTFGAGSQPNFSFIFFGNQSTTLLASVGYRTTQDSDTTQSPETLLLFAQVGSFSTFGPDLFVGTVDVLGGAIRELFFSATLLGDTNVDFSNTAGFDLTSPVDFSSASGVFLSERGSSLVPEPSSIFLFVSGLIGLILATRRRAIDSHSRSRKFAGQNPHWRPT